MRSTCSTSRLARRACAALALVLALSAATATAATSGKYHGKTKQGFGVSFRVTSSSVVGFNTVAGALCISVASGRSVHEGYPILRQPAARLVNGRFAIHFKGTSSTFVDITGHVSGSSASGRLDVRYTKTLGITSTGLLDIGACSAHTTWTARRG